MFSNEELLLSDLIRRVLGTFIVVVPGLFEYKLLDKVVLLILQHRTQRRLLASCIATLDINVIGLYNIITFKFKKKLR